MKTTIKSIAAILVAALLLSVNTSCKKEGPAGPAGADGINGTNGTNGNANVKSQTSVVSTWTWDNTNSFNSANISVPDLTSDIYLTGAVFVYLKTTSNSWAPLARTIALTGSTSQNQRFVYNTGNVEVIIQNSDLTQPTSSTLTYKIVCMSSSAMIKYKDVNMYKYSEVKEALKLKD